MSIGTLPSGHTYTAFTAPQSFAVTAKDGAGNIIVGTYTAPITLRNSDTTGATTIATAGSDTATLDYGGQAVVSATISAAAANASGASAIFTPGPALPPDIYVSDSLNKTVSQILAAGGYTTVNTLCSGFNYPDGLALDATGNIFLADQYTGSTGTIKQMVAPNYTTINTLVNRLNYPEMVAVDASDNVFFSVTNAGVVYEAMAPTYTTLNPIGSGFSGPAGVALDASDNLFVTDSFNNAVYEVLAAGGYTTVNTLQSGVFNYPIGIAVDARRNLFVGAANNNAVKGDCGRRRLHHRQHDRLGFQRAGRYCGRCKRQRLRG